MGIIDDYRLKFAPKRSMGISQSMIKEGFLQIIYIMSSPTPLNYRHFMHYQDCNTEDSSNYNIDQSTHMDLNRQYRDLMQVSFHFLSSNLPERDSQLSEEDFKTGFFQNMARLAQEGRQLFEAMHKHPNPANRQSAPRSSRLVPHRQQSHQDLHADMDPHPPSQKSHTHPLHEARDREKDDKQKGWRKRKDANNPPGTPQAIHSSVMRRTTTKGKNGLPLQSFFSINSRGLPHETSERESGRPKSRSSRSQQMLSAQKSPSKTKFRKTPARLNRFNLGRVALYDFPLPRPFKKPSEPKKKFKSKSPPGSKKLKSKSSKGAKGGDSKSKNKSKKVDKGRKLMHNAGLRSGPKA